MNKEYRLTYDTTDKRWLTDHPVAEIPSVNLKSYLLKDVVICSEGKHIYFHHIDFEEIIELKRVPWRGKIKTRYLLIDNCWHYVRASDLSVTKGSYCDFWHTTEQLVIVDGKILELTQHV